SEEVDAETAACGNETSIVVMTLSQARTTMPKGPDGVRVVRPQLSGGTMKRIALVLLLLASPAHGGETVVCASVPGSEEGPERWLYRFVEGRTCWFLATGRLRRGREKPLEELKWPPVGFEERWGGWSHKE